MIIFSWNPINWIRWWKCEHEWRGWLYGYPTYTSVAQYNECERCGMRKRSWVVKPSERHVSEAERERGAHPDASTRRCAKSYEGGPDAE